MCRDELCLRAAALSRLQHSTSHAEFLELSDACSGVFWSPCYSCGIHRLAFEGSLLEHKCLIEAQGQEMFIKYSKGRGPQHGLYEGILVLH